MNNYNESTAPKVEYKAFPHLFNLVAMRARFKLRSFYNDVSALENKLKKDNDVNKSNKKSLDVLLLRSSSNRNEERKDNNNGSNKSTCVDSKVLSRYYKKTFVDLYKDECAIASKLIASENKVIDYYNKNNFIQFKSNKYKLKPTTNNSNNSNNSNNCSNSTSTVQLAPILSRRNIKPHSHYKPSTVPPSKVIPQLLDNVAHHKRLRTHKSNSLSFFHRYDHHLNKSTDDIEQQFQGVDKEGNVIDANLAVKPIFKLTTHAMINKGVFRINMTRNQWSSSNGSGNDNSNSGIGRRKLSEPMEGFNFDYVKFASYDLGMLNKGKIERRYSM
jgi:hypothetical protein